MSASSYDVAVIGAGVFGAWTAYQLQRSGKQVALVDGYGAGNNRSSSGGESRIIRMGYGRDEVYTRSAHRSLQLWRELLAESGEKLFYQSGVLWLAQDDDRYPVETAETLARVGIPFEKLTTRDVAKRYPQIGLDGISWAMFEPGSGVLMARRAVQAVARRVVESDTEYFQDAVESPPGTGKLDQISTTSGRRISAAQFVFACGPWLPKLFPKLLGDRIQSTRQEVFFFGVPTGDARYGANSLPAWIDFKSEVYGLPDLENRGIKIAIDRHGPPFDPDSGNRVVTEAGLKDVRAGLARRLPGLRDAPLTESRVCQYENTSNGDFLIDRHPEFDNVWLVGGGSGHGFKHGPVVGEYLAARIDGSVEGTEPRFSLESKARGQKRSVY